MPGLGRAWLQLQSILAGWIGLTYFLGKWISTQIDFELLEPNKGKFRALEILLRNERVKISVLKGGKV